MPAKLSLSPVPTQLHTVHRQFEQWRRTRRSGTLIPPPLWAAAVAVARRQGISRTARALYLDSHKLKTMADASGGVHCAPASPTFVEVPARPPAGWLPSARSSSRARTVAGCGWCSAACRRQT